jgi:hypothetical protein
MPNIFDDEPDDAWLARVERETIDIMNDWRAVIRHVFIRAHQGQKYITDSTFTTMRLICDCLSQAKTIRNELERTLQYLCAEAENEETELDMSDIIRDAFDDALEDIIDKDGGDFCDAWWAENLPELEAQP